MHLPPSSHYHHSRRQPVAVARALPLYPAGSGWRAVVAATALAGWLMVCALPAPGAEGANGPSLSKLEVKFFQHDYPKDTLSARLERLEKMVFGEIKSGSDYDRLQSLLAAVPNLNPKVGGGEEQEPDIPGSGSVAGGAGSGNRQSAAQPEEDRNYVPPQGSKYPAVSAIESRILGKDYAAEPIAKRLDRLEAKLFGRPSGSDDLMERVDRIKQRAGVDIARQAPSGSDWADEDEDMDYINEPTASGGGEDGKSFSGRDLRKDMQRAFGIPPGGNLTDRFSSNGSYGMGGGGSSYRAPSAPSVPSSPSRTGMPSYGGAPAPAPAPPRQARAPQSPQPALGLNDQVGALEQEIFGRTYRDPLPARLNRLESTIFPQEKPAIDKSLPERVQRLSTVIPLSKQRQVAQSPRGDDLDEDFDDMGSPAPRPAPPRASSGLSKIINSISGFLGGGGYPMGGGALTTDPQTGLLFDSLSGNLIDPVTGVVVGQRLNPGTGMGSGFGSFGSGFSQYGTVPYGIGSGSRMRFGFGGMGGMGSGFGIGGF